MALRRLLLGISALSLLYGNVALAQFEPTTANQDGILLLDGLGWFYSGPATTDQLGAFIFWNLENQRLGFGAPVAKQLEWVADANGNPIGAYVLDIYGGQHTLNVERKLEDLPINVTDADLLSKSPAVVKVATPLSLGANNPAFTIPPFWGFDVARDLKIAPDWRTVTFGYQGYFVLDADGVVHPLGETNLPSYAYYKPGSTNLSDAAFVEILYPETIDVSKSSITPEKLLTGGPITYPVNRVYVADSNPKSVTPMFTYFGPGSDIARGMEVSVEYAELTVPSKFQPGLIENRKVAMTNGYYILDGFGAVHSCRLGLDFDVNNDGKILYTDMYKDFDKGELNPDFGNPINNAVLSPAWADDQANLPYFGIDVAVDMKITPSGKGFYLLDAYGGVYAVGDAHFSFPPVMVDGKPVKSFAHTPYFGIPVAKSLALVTNKANQKLGLTQDQVTVGYLVLDGFGTVHAAGIAETFGVSETGNKGRPIIAPDTLRAVKTTPVWLPKAPPDVGFIVNSSIFDLDVAPNFRNVTAAYTTVSAPAP